MTAQIDFLPVGTSNGATVMTQSNFVSSSMLTTGVQVGVADPTLANKCWRQSSIIASVVANYISSKTGQNVIDDGTTATILANLASAIALSTYTPDTSGTANVLTATITPAPPSLQNGLIVALMPANNNNSSATFNLNGLGAYAVQNAGGALVGGELVAGNIYQLAWLSARSVWFILGATTTAVTQPSTDNSTKIATTAFVKSIGYAPLASPIFTGTPQAPTPGAGDNSTNIATTAFISAALYGTSGILPSGTRLLFANPSAPPGWTQDTSTYANNRMIRVVSVAAGTTGSGGTGGNAYGGTMDPTINNVVPSHTHGVTTGTESAAHSHAYTYASNFLPQSGSATACWYGTQSVQTGTESANHTHSGTTDNGSSQTNYTPQWLSLILCTKN